MPPCPTLTYAAATNAPIPINLEEILPESSSESEDDILQSQRQMDAKKKRLKDAMKAKIGELRDKKWKEKADWKKQEELDRRKHEVDESWNEEDQKRQELWTI